MMADRSPETLRRADVRRCGTLWVAELSEAPDGLPSVPIGVRIREVREGDAGPLRRAMEAAGADNPGLARLRIRGKRLGYLAEAEAEARSGELEDRRTDARNGSGMGSVLAYGWVARPGDTVNDLGFDLELPPGEAWIYDCATVPQARGKGLYTALLVTMRRELARFGIQHGWIGTDPRNWASQRGIVRAGFLKVADMDWNGSRTTAYGVPGVSPALLRMATTALGDGPETQVLPGAGIPVIEGEAARGADEGIDEGIAVPTDLMRFRATYGEQIAWRDVTPEAGAGEVTLRSQGRAVTLRTGVTFEALVDALDSIAPGIPWLDGEP